MNMIISSRAEPNKGVPLFNSCELRCEIKLDTWTGSAFPEKFHLGIKARIFKLLGFFSLVLKWHHKVVSIRNYSLSAIFENFVSRGCPEKIE